MEPSIFSPILPSGTILASSFDHPISFLPSDDSIRPLLSAHDHPDSVLFDAYMANKLPNNMHYPLASSPPSTSYPTPSSSERSSMDEPPIVDSESQATITQAIFRAEAAKLKKKRSLGRALKSLRSSSRDLTGSLRGTKRVPFPLQLEESSVLTIGSETLPSSSGQRLVEDDEGFEDRNRTVRRRNMPHHPFRSEDVPYMQAYSQILLENDYQMHQLLCRLNRPDSPTFHRFKKPPADVLDLGCGEGFWVLHAAKLWKSSNTRLTGLDLIDMHNNDVGEVHPSTEPVHVPKNVTWVRANFVKYPLPFPDNSFDLVRMANLTLCIPVSRWKFVLTQVRRVLRPGGRLELIDDELFFPSVIPRAQPRRPQWQRSTSEQAFAPQRSSSLSPTKHYRTPQASPNSKNKMGHARTPSETEFSTNTAIAAHLETIFTNMLANKYGISPRPHLLLEQMLPEVFGPDNVRQTQELELAVPARELSDTCQGLGLNPGFKSSTGTASPGHTKRASEDEKLKPGWMSLDWEKKEKRPGTAPGTIIPIPISLPTSGRSSLERRSEDSSIADLDLKIEPHLKGSLTPKARQLLFGDSESGFGLGAGVGKANTNTYRDRTPSWRENGPYQPPGLVLLPSTLVPFSPLELEMHACKHMNTLLGCKYALGKYVSGQKNARGQALLSEKEVDDYLWDYECFRRKRFNWPQDITGLQMEDEPDEPVGSSAPSSKPSIFNKFASATGSNTPPALEPHRTLSSGSAAHGLGTPPMYGGVAVTRQQSTRVRTIRVYEVLNAHRCSGCHCNGSC